MANKFFNELSVDQIEKKIIDSLDIIQNLRFQKTLQQLEDLSTIKKTKKELAQLKTVLNEFKIGIRK